MLLIATGKPPLLRESGTVTAAVRRAVETMNPFVQGRNQTLSAHLQQIDFRTDVEHLARAIENLIRNASTAARNGGMVAIHVRLTTTPGAVVTVRDDGPGIPESLLPYLFAVNTGSMEGTGYGVGLQSARVIIDALGGRLHCKSYRGVGTSFHVELPSSWGGLNLEPSPAKT